MLRFAIIIDKKFQHLRQSFTFQHHQREIIIEPIATVTDNLNAVYIDVSFSDGIPEELMIMAKKYCKEAYIFYSSSNDDLGWIVWNEDNSDPNAIAKSSIFLNYLQRSIIKYLDITDIYSQEYLHQNHIFDLFRKLLGLERTMLARIASAFDDLIENDKVLLSLSSLFAYCDESESDDNGDELLRDFFDWKWQQPPWSLRTYSYMSSGFFSPLEISAVERPQTLIVAQEQVIKKDDNRAKKQEARHKQSAVMFKQPKQRNHQQTHKHRNTGASAKRYK